MFHYGYDANKRYIVSREYSVILWFEQIILRKLLWMIYGLCLANLRVYQTSFLNPLDKGYFFRASNIEIPSCYSICQQKKSSSSLWIRLGNRRFISPSHREIGFNFDQIFFRRIFLSNSSWIMMELKANAVKLSWAVLRNFLCRASLLFLY